MSETPTIANPQKPLAGRAKQYLDDLRELNAKTTQEMGRGIQERYLDFEGAMELAEKLGVEKPRVKRSFSLYFTVTELYTFSVEAHDETEAMELAERYHEHNIANGSLHYGSLTRFGDYGGSTPHRRRFSPLQSERPQLDTPLTLHRWQQEMADTARESNGGSRIDYKDLSRRCQRLS